MGYNYIECRSSRTPILNEYIYVALDYEINNVAYHTLPRGTLVSAQGALTACKRKM